jgi:hypothetical protein
MGQERGRGEMPDGCLLRLAPAKVIHENAVQGQRDAPVKQCTGEGKQRKRTECAEGIQALDAGSHEVALVNMVLYYRKLQYLSYSGAFVFILQKKKTASQGGRRCRKVNRKADLMHHCEGQRSEVVVFVRNVETSNSLELWSNPDFVLLVILPGFNPGVRHLE